MANATKHPDTGESGRRRQPARPDQSPAESPDPPVREQDADRHGRWPPGGLPNPMPDVERAGQSFLYRFVRFINHILYWFDR